MAQGGDDMADNREEKELAASENEEQSPETEKSAAGSGAIGSMKDLFEEAEAQENEKQKRAEKKALNKEKAKNSSKEDNAKADNVSDKTYKRVMLIVIPLIGILAVVMAFMTVNLVKILKKPQGGDTTTSPYVYGTVTYAPETTSFDFNETFPNFNVTENNAESNADTTAAVINAEPPASTAVIDKTDSADPVSWSKAQKLAALSQAINKTKALGGLLSVHHTESFTANITECTGGSIGKAFANSLMGMVVKPVDEALSFSGGKATNSEGETVEILLPKKGAFSIDEAGVSKAVAYKSGEYTVIEVTLIGESVGVYDVPKYNAGAVGYLDVKSFDLMGIEITDASIDYKGTVITVKIGSDGYVKAAEYIIPLHVSGKGSKGSLSGYAVFDGEQRETWEF